MMLEWHLIVAEVKDLCVTVDSRLNFDTHIRQAVARAFVRSNLTHKCFVSRDVFTLLRALKVYVLPIIEYASCMVAIPCQSSKTNRMCAKKVYQKAPGLCLTEL